MDTKTIQRQINEAKTELEALRTDEAQLAQLHSDKAAELETMRASKSRDFASMAALEGQRAALQTMLEEQRGMIGEIETRISDLEAQRAREGHLEKVGKIAREIEQARADLFTGLSTLASNLTPELERLILIHARWAQLRQDWEGEADALGASHRPGWRSIDRLPAIRALRDELRERGVSVDMLSLNVGGFTTLEEDQPDTLPIGGPHDPYADFPYRVGYLLAGVFSQALHGYYAANHPAAVEARAERAGLKETEELPELEGVEAEQVGA